MELGVELELGNQLFGQCSGAIVKDTGCLCTILMCVCVFVHSSSVYAQVSIFLSLLGLGRNHRFFSGLDRAKDDRRQDLIP